MTLTVLEVREADDERIRAALSAHLRRASDFFRGMPVVLSLSAAVPDLSSLVSLLREHELVPVGVLDGDPKQAGAAGLGVISGGKTPRDVGERKQSRPESAQTAPQAAPRSARLIDRQVRSGQQIYARDSDLVITAAVNKGAEVIADGHIHIYNSLRGRALAGASGDTSARIFCQRFEPDLIALAGCYKVADDIVESVRGRAVQVRLEGEHLIIEAQE